MQGPLPDAPPALKARAVPAVDDILNIDRFAIRYSFHRRVRRGHRVFIIKASNLSPQRFLRPPRWTFFVLSPSPDRPLRSYFPKSVYI